MTSDYGDLGSYLNQLNSQISGGGLNATQGLAQLAQRASSGGFAGPQPARQAAAPTPYAGFNFGPSGGPGKDPTLGTANYIGDAPGGRVETQQQYRDRLSRVAAQNGYATNWASGQPTYTPLQGRDPAYEQVQLQQMAQAGVNPITSGMFRPNLGGGGLQPGRLQAPGGQQAGLQSFGFGVEQGVPGGALNMLEQQGMPIPDFLRQISGGRPVGLGELNKASQQLGGSYLPTPQALSRMSPSELQFLEGFFTTMLGIPFSDIMQATGQPFQGLRSARQARGGFR